MNPKSQDCYSNSCTHQLPVEQLEVEIFYPYTKTPKLFIFYGDVHHLFVEFLTEILCTQQDDPDEKNSDWSQTPVVHKEGVIINEGMDPGRKVGCNLY